MMLLRKKGFTLIELVMVMTLLSIISVVVGRTLLAEFNAMVSFQNTNEADWQGLVAIQRISNDIRSIRSYNDITTITATQLAFTDVDGNSVSFSRTGNNLMRNSTVLAAGVTGLAFTYLNSSGAVTATSTLVRYITVSLTLTQSNIVTSYSTMVAVRG